MDPTHSKGTISLISSLPDPPVLIFPLLSVSLSQLLQSNSFYGLPLELVRRFSLQILNSLAFLQQSGVVHGTLST